MQAAVASAAAAVARRRAVGSFTAAAARRRGFASVTAEKPADAAAEAASSAKQAVGGAFSKLPRHPDYSGIEAVVRYYLPHNYQLSMAVMGMYVTLIGFAIMRSNAKSKLEEAQKVPEYPDFSPKKSTGGVPSIEDEEWESWIEADEENIEKWIAAASEEEE